MSLSAITGNYSNFFPSSLLGRVQELKPNCDTQSGYSLLLTCLTATRSNLFSWHSLLTFST